MRYLNARCLRITLFAGSSCTSRSRKGSSSFEVASELPWTGLARIRYNIPSKFRVALPMMDKLPGCSSASSCQRASAYWHKRIASNHSDGQRLVPPDE